MRVALSSKTHAYVLSQKPNALAKFPEPEVKSNGRGNTLTYELSSAQRDGLRRSLTRLLVTIPATTVTSALRVSIHLDIERMRYL